MRKIPSFASKEATVDYYKIAALQNIKRKRSINHSSSDKKILKTIPIAKSPPVVDEQLHYCGLQFKTSLLDECPIFFETLFDLES
jgi:hypothetical protein